MIGPCDWPVDYCDSTPPPSWLALSLEGRERYERSAVEYLWRWTGRTLGLCEVQVRPCRESPTVSSGLLGGLGLLAPGRLPWGSSAYCGACGTNCGCEGPESLRVPGPVESVTAVQIGADVLPPEAYRLEAGVIVRQDGQRWPSTQDLALPLGAPGTWAITYRRGVPVPFGGQVAAGVLAVELFKAACQDDSCGLPKRFQSITRQGTTVAMLDAFDDVDKGHTGIWVIDSWVASMTQPPSRSRVYSPDTYRPRVTRATP